MIIDEKGIISYILFDNKDNWDTVLSQCPGYMTQRTLDRIKSISIKSLVIEKQYIDKDYRNTFSIFHSKKFVTPKARCIRLHFFAAAIDFENPDKVSWEKCYGGYIILRPTLPNNIGRTLLSPRLFTNKKSYLCLCEESVMVNGVEMKIEGFPFISQDTDATVCAQSALWMLLRYFSNRYHWYKEVYPSDITNLVKSHPHGRSMPGAGLTMMQMNDVLRELGFTPLLYVQKEYGNDFLKYAYSYLESGFPLIVGLPKHAVVAVGHTSDFTLQASSSSFEYLEGFIINDDNRLPYYKITHNKTDESDSYCLGDIDSFIVPLPNKVFLSADQFETLITVAIKIFKEKDVEIPPLKRFFLTTGRSFKKRVLNRYQNIPELRNFYLKYPLPHFIWVCEFSGHELYSKQFKCLGEIIWDATRNAYEDHLGLVIHMPNIVIYDSGAVINNDPYYQSFPLNNNTYTIYNNNLKEI